MGEKNYFDEKRAFLGYVNHYPAIIFSRCSSFLEFKPIFKGYFSWHFCKGIKSF